MPVMFIKAVTQVENFQQQKYFYRTFCRTSRNWGICMSAPCTRQGNEVRYLFVIINRKLLNAIIYLLSCEILFYWEQIILSFKPILLGHTYIWTFNLRTREKPSKWVLAGVALLLQIWISYKTFISYFNCTNLLGIILGTKCSSM